MIRFVANFRDISTDRGFQFRFHCDRCHNGFVSQFEPNTMGTAASLLGVASSILGGRASLAARGAYEIQRAIGSTDHDEALQRAIEEGKHFFKQCPRCGRWVCPDVCWNSTTNLCRNCAPDTDLELAALQAQAARTQLWAKTLTTDQTPNVDTAAPVQITYCEKCGERLKSTTKFCAECGAPNLAAQERVCACGEKLAPGAKFCPECGTKA